MRLANMKLREEPAHFGEAMECRCYRGGDGRTRLKVLRCTRQDYIDLAVCIVCFMVILSSRLVFPNF